jgi:enoyl-CoA hydratase/carnithine racemase
VEEIVSRICAIEVEDPWIQKAVKTLKNGCPLTMKLVEQQILKGKHKSLAEVFQMELNLAVSCCIDGEFQEGVRALLIDKDGVPHWQYPTIESVPDDVVNEFFESGWGQRCLADLVE